MNEFGKPPTKCQCSFAFSPAAMVRLSPSGTMRCPECSTELHTHDAPTPIVIEGERLKCIIQNAHRLLKNKHKGQPLWVIVSELTGHGSQVSAQLCHQCGFEPDAKCGSKSLVNL